MAVSHALCVHVHAHVHVCVQVYVFMPDPVKVPGEYTAPTEAGFQALTGPSQMLCAIGCKATDISPVASTSQDWVRS